MYGLAVVWLVIVYSIISIVAQPVHILVRVKLGRTVFHHAAPTGGALEPVGRAHVELVIVHNQRTMTAFADDLFDRRVDVVVVVVAVIVHDNGDDRRDGRKIKCTAIGL